VQINLQENVLRSLLVSVFVSSIRAQVPPALHRTYLLSTQNMEYARAPLGMTNAYVGYTFLVDEHLRVRWAACADAKPEEAAGLERCVGLLLDRMSEEKAAEAAVQEAPPAV
jgi:ATPase complex subunit ATP10